MMGKVFKKIKSAVRECVENSDIRPPPRKIFLARVFGINISLANVINVMLAVIVVTLIVLTEYGHIPSKKVGFYCKDPLISYKYAGDTVTPGILGATIILLQTLIILSTEMLINQSYKKINIFTTWFLLKECTVGLATVLFITSMAKVLMGEHRPHFFDVCEPDTARNCTEGSFVEDFNCTSTKFEFYDIADSSLSFPSGHASISWFLGMYLSYIVHARLPTINAGNLMKTFLIAACLTWSTVCSVTRITDRRHHWWDVLAGTTIGILYSLYSISLVRKKLAEVDYNAVRVGVRKEDDSMEMA